MSVSVILPAHNEAEWIGGCLDALLASDHPQVQVIVVANGCTDDTADLARARIDAAAAKGWELSVIDTATGGKLSALNIGDAAATGAIRVYLDADVVISSALLGQIAGALDRPEPRYATGTPRVVRAQTAVTRAYARLWVTLPFVTRDAPGFGLFAVNEAGRKRWGDWPDIISDDTFARLQFAPAERLRLPAAYDWPMVEGFANLVRVRRRQNDGVAEFARRYPELLANDATPGVGAIGALRRLLCDPLGFATYAAVTLAVKTPLFKSRNRWVRGR
jgi:glycosyltransferase involved in cell wall biosynthesis